MSKLVLFGGKPEVDGPIARFNTIGQEEKNAVLVAMDNDPLSGFLGGKEHGGLWVRRLEEKWAETFKVKHAISMNSATSGLLAVAATIDNPFNRSFLVSPYTMSATVAAPMFCGTTPVFSDIEPDTFNLDLQKVWPWGAIAELENVKAIVVTNLFGHAAELRNIRESADRYELLMIEDNAQSPFAMEDGKYAGTFGHIGVFSTNVHKHLQSGEGGICVTDDDDLAHNMRMFRNHGEMSGGMIGLNLRMTEITAAIALAQLQRADEIISDRIKIAERLTEAVKDLPGITPPVVREGCRHVYYCWAAKLDNGIDRDLFVKAMNAEGVPLRAGYMKPLYTLPEFSAYARSCPVVEDVEKRLVLYENCSWSPTSEQVKQIGNAFEKVIGEIL